MAYPASYQLIMLLVVKRRKMSISYRSRIGLREIAAMEPHTILWDLVPRGFCARRQFSDVITYSVYFRTRDGRQRFYKIGRHGVFTPTQAREAAKEVLRNVAVGKDPGAELKAPRATVLRSLTCAMNMSSAPTAKRPQHVKERRQPDRHAHQAKAWEAKGRIGDERKWSKTFMHEPVAGKRPSASRVCSEPFLPLL